MKKRHKITVVSLFCCLFLLAACGKDEPEGILSEVVEEGRTEGVEEAQVPAGINGASTEIPAETLGMDFDIDLAGEWEVSGLRMDDVSFTKEDLASMGITEEEFDLHLVFSEDGNGYSELHDGSGREEFAWYAMSTTDGLYVMLALGSYDEALLYEDGTLLLAYSAEDVAELGISRDSTFAMVFSRIEG